MKKLLLDVEELAVESFATSKGASAERGTVHGHYGTTHTQDASCFTCESCHSGCHTWLCARPDEA